MEINKEIFILLLGLFVLQVALVAWVGRAWHADWIQGTSMGLVPVVTRGEQLLRDQEVPQELPAAQETVR